ncbi:hypothetical protein BB561_003613 [Smittium simulii]|uniref:Ribosomal RNA-processing protein 8 n=1 Tax=Smittium simulii TaxID=133385 RepID=A0A2T9YKF0_9FUNG|nr:hypothetical protein BB561_003613 [Smittium simulii]
MNSSSQQKSKLLKIKKLLELKSKAQESNSVDTKDASLSQKTISKRKNDNSADIKTTKPQKVGTTTVEQQNKKLKPMAQKPQNTANPSKQQQKVENTVTPSKQQQKVQNTVTPSKLQQKMQSKLEGARFRWINEKFYTSSGKDAFDLTQNDPSVFEEARFGQQVKSWPLNPVDLIIENLKKQKPGLDVADMGCGEAKIAQTLSKVHKIRSFDLVAHNEFIEACDITKVPVKNESMDVSIFCLALMGTNWIEFIFESCRILKKGGELIIAEVISRIVDIDEFVKCLTDCGLELLKQDKISKMFIFFIFKKTSNIDKKLKIELKNRAETLLKPCIYKRR